MSQDKPKQAAAKAALNYVKEGSILGVGTGSTTNLFIDAMADQGIRLEGAVASSQETAKRLQQHGYEVIELNHAGRLDTYIDGADEFTDHFHLIKGGGGALTREKVIAACSDEFVCIVGADKHVGMLGEFPLPIEVIPMARSFVARELVAMGGQPVWREGFVSDNHCDIIDIHYLEILDPVEMERRINQIPGVVTVGLFAARGADVLLIGQPDGTCQTQRRSR